MINASGSTLPNSNPTEKKPAMAENTTPTPINTPSTQATANPSFPTHNPAVQHQQFMKNTGVPTTQAKKPVTNDIGATPPAAPKFPDPTKNLIKVTKAGTDTTSNSGGDTTKPKRKMNLKMVLGIVVLLLVILGSGAGFYLTQYTQQDVRQQAAYEKGCDNGVPHGGTACQTQGASSYWICNDGTYTGPNACPTGQTCQGSSCKAGTGTLQCQNGAQDRDQNKVLVCNCDKCTEKTDDSEGGGGKGWVCDDNCKLVDIGSISSAKTSECNQVDYVHSGTSNYCGVKEINCPDSCKTTTTTNYKCNDSCTSSEQCAKDLGSAYSCQSGKCRLTANPTATDCKPATDLQCNSSCELSPAGGFDICTDKLGAAYSCISNKCRLTANPESTTCATTAPAGRFTAVCSPADQEAGDLSYKLTQTGVQPENAGAIVYGIYFNKTNFNKELTDGFLGKPTWSVESCEKSIDTDGWCGYWLKQVNDPTPNTGGDTIAWTWDGTFKQPAINNKTINEIATKIDQLKAAGTLAENYKINIGVEYRIPGGEKFKGQTGQTQSLDISTGACSEEEPEKLVCNDACTTTAECQSDLGADYSCVSNKCRLTSNPTSATCTPKEVVKLKCDDACTAPAAGQTDQCTTDIGAGYSCIDSKCRLTANPDSQTCVAALTCNQSCTPSDTNDLCTEANTNWVCDTTSSSCRFATNLTSEECAPPVGAVACNDSCTSDEQCTKTNTAYTCDTTSQTCRLAENPDSEECEVSKPKCNDSCNSDEECQRTDSDHICDASTNTCRLESNTASETCEEKTETEEETVGCNDTCINDSDCANSNHVCATTADSTKKCRLEEYPDSTTCTLPTDSTAQPVAPTTLPETGPADWLNWFKAGLVTLGLGAALFFLL